MTENVGRTHYKRFSPAQRFEHFVLIVSLIGLAVTGVSQLYATQPWAESIILVLGGIESVRILHHYLAALLIIEAAYHAVSIGYQLLVMRRAAAMRPRRRDFQDFRGWLLYNLGRRPDRPRMPRYNFSEKFDYWLVVISFVIMFVTGLMLWNPIATAATLSGEALPVALAIHRNQALLLIGLVIVWHGFNVLVKQFNLSIFSGHISRRIMQEEHAEELEQIEASQQAQPLSEAEVARRNRAFWPVAIVITIIVAAGLIRFLTYQQTAITTVPRQDVAIFAPNVQPASGDPKVGAALWATLRCPICHGEQATGGPEGAPALRGTSLTFEKFYKQVRNGSDKMPAYRPEELPDGYLTHLWAWLSSKPSS